MTNPTPAELIEEARLWPRDGVNEGRLINSLADALEAVELERNNWQMSAEEAERAEQRWEQRVRIAEQRAEAWKRLCESTETAMTEVIEERNQLAAVMEKARAEVEGESGWFRHRAGRVLDMLATAPADALAEHDAALLEGLADEVHATLSDPNRKRPRDPRGEFATDLLNDVAWAVHLIREKARQRREGQK